MNAWSAAKDNGKPRLTLSSLNVEPDKIITYPFRVDRQRIQEVRALAGDYGTTITYMLNKVLVYGLASLRAALEQKRKEQAEYKERWREEDAAEEQKQLADLAKRRG